MKIVYISGPYSSNSRLKQMFNICRAKTVAKEYWKLGYAVFCPHTNSANMNNVAPYEHFINGDLEILSRCDIVVMLPDWNKSKGASKERELAYKLNKEVIYK